MDKILEKLADKLLSLDEASLACLWNKYYQQVQRFEPSKKWERSVIILSMIQAVRWKNQLFNLKWLHLTRLEKRFNRKFPMEVREKKDIAGPVLKPEKRQKDKGKVIFLNIKDEDKGK
ncbi:hypothetical protein JCM13304A_11400 [Desulfothermus okinawensis JCM 13304]